MMDDDTMLRTLLRRTASGDPLEPTDPEPLVRRGDRVVRRRRVVGVTTAVAAVAAVTWGANSLTGIDSSDGTPPVATVKTTASAAPKLFEPVPGVQPGEAALGKVSTAEATRRCRLRDPADSRRLTEQWGGFWGGGTATYDINVQSPRLGFYCHVPGDSRPTSQAVALASRDRFPASDADKLRNCSVGLWHDVTGWRILTLETEPGQLMNFLAVSPSGRHVATCSLTRNPRKDGLANTRVMLVNPPPDPVMDKEMANYDPLKHFPVAGSQTCGGAPGQACIGWLHDEVGRVDPKIARIRVEKPNGRVHDIKVVEGWFAFAWGDRDPKGGPDAKVTSYDAAGKVIKKYN